MAAFETIIIDDREQEAASDKPMLPHSRIDGDLVDLVSGSLDSKLGDRPAAFAFSGISLGDYAAAVLAVQWAECPTTNSVLNRA